GDLENRAPLSCRFVPEIFPLLADDLVGWQVARLYATSGIADCCPLFPERCDVEGWRVERLRKPGRGFLESVQHLVHAYELRVRLAAAFRLQSLGDFRSQA